MNISAYAQPNSLNRGTVLKDACSKTARKGIRRSMMNAASGTWCHKARESAHSPSSFDNDMSHVITSYLHTTLYCFTSTRNVRPVYGTASSVPYTGREFLSRRRDGQGTSHDATVPVFPPRSAVMRCTYTRKGGQECRGFFGIHSLGGSCSQSFGALSFRC